ncbi:Flagellar biosynthesis protein, FliO [Massilia sp. PDC64]|nr:flagellar biosynthetic protein FliO [Massilia sp. PDC64]SDF63635.1 Flagellar biosynthesis protein, FliO [Massilia sp. PDC64]
MTVQQNAAPAPHAAVPAIPFRRDDGAMGPALAGGGAGVLVVSLLAIAAVWYLRRRFNLHAGAAGGKRLVRVVESTRLGPRTLLSVVEFDGTRYLVAQGEHGVTCLAEKPLAPQEAP